MYCNNCGTDLGSSSKFCPACGEPVAKLPAAGKADPAKVSTEPTLPLQAFVSPAQTAVIDPMSGLDKVAMPQAMPLSPTAPTAPTAPIAPQQQVATTRPLMPQLQVTPMQPLAVSTQVMPDQGTYPQQGVHQQGVHQQGMYQQGVYQQGMYQQGQNPQFNGSNSTPQKKPKKSKKGLWIALIIIAVLAIASAAAFVGYQLYVKGQYDQAQALFSSKDYDGAYDAFEALGSYEDSPDMKKLCEQWLDFEAANALLEDEDYEAALDGFTALGSFEDSQQLAESCQLQLDYIEAQEQFNAGSFDEALSSFEALMTKGFYEVEPWINKTKYAQADKLQTDGNLYEAYKAFKALGSYDEAAARMAACTTPFPANGTISFDQAYASSNAELIIDGGATTYSSYFKLYSGTTLVSAFWLNPGGSVTLGLTPGDYSLKQAVGDVWFGDEIMFGEEGTYMELEFDTGKTFNLGYNIQMTLTFAGSDAGANVGTSLTNPSGF